MSKQKIKDFLIIVSINIVLFSVFSFAAEKENTLFTKATEQHIQQFTDFRK